MFDFLREDGLYSWTLLLYIATFAIAVVARIRGGKFWRVMLMLCGFAWGKIASGADLFWLGALINAAGIYQLWAARGGDT